MVFTHYCVCVYLLIKNITEFCSNIKKYYKSPASEKLANVFLNPSLTRWCGLVGAPQPPGPGLGNQSPIPLCRTPRSFPRPWVTFGLGISVCLSGLVIWSSLLLTHAFVRPSDRPDSALSQALHSSSPLLRTRSFFLGSQDVVVAGPPPSRAVVSCYCHLL